RRGASRSPRSVWRRRSCVPTGRGARLGGDPASQARGERSVAQQDTGCVPEAVQVLTTGPLPLRTARDLMVVMAPELEIAMFSVVPLLRLLLTRVVRLSALPLLFTV